MKHLFRWRAIVPLSLFFGFLALGCLVFLDTLVERGIEDIGAEILGAKFDVESVDVDLTAGRVRLSGIAAANPDSPMRNLFEADELVADVRMAPLLKKKVVIQEAALRGLRFGTARKTSGKLDNPRPGSGRLTRELTGWVNSIKVPPLNLTGLGQAVNLGAIAGDSLRSLAAARATTEFADSVRSAWEAQLNALDPTALLDSARQLVVQVNSANPLTLGLRGGAKLLSSGRSTLESINQLQSRLAALDSNVRLGMDRLNQTAKTLAAAREADYRYALGLLNLPSLDSPDISAGIFGEMAVARVKPILYWMNRVAEYLPPGLDPRRSVGPKRARRSGTTVTFPGQKEYPGFLLEKADLDMEIGGTGAAAGRYAAHLVGLSTEPAKYGQPLTLSLARAAGSAGPREVRVNARLDHTGARIRDSVSVSLSGLALPSLELNALGAKLDLGKGVSELALAFTGDSIAGRWRWRSSEARWSQLSTGDAQSGSGGSVDNTARDFLWRTVSASRTVSIDVRFRGSAKRPSLSVGSNIGRAVASSIRQQLGREIGRAQTQMRARVDRLVGGPADDAQSKVNSLEASVEQKLGDRLGELRRVRADLERSLRKLGRF
ncbi:MAG: hypothetical protein ACE5HT_02965 [Gemmatimonadales bacterium]